MAEVELAVLLDTAATLRLAGRWEQAAVLLFDLEPLTDSERAAVALAVADIGVDQAWWRIGTDPGPALDDAAKALAAVAEADPAAAWDLDLLRLRETYGAAFQARHGAGSTGTDGPDSTDPGQALDEWASRLQATAPDPLRAGWAAFWGGVIADNLRDLPDTARDRYEVARAAAEDAGDGLLLSYVLRHLGFHAKTAGDLITVRELWIRSMNLRDQVGFVPGALGQRLAVADLLLAEGDHAGAAAMATDVERTVRAVGLNPGLGDAAAELASRARSNSGQGH